MKQLLVTSLVLVPLAGISLCGCAKKDTRIEFSTLRPAQHESLEYPGTWRAEGEAFVNTFPDEVEGDSAAMAKGEGSAIALLPDFKARDVRITTGFKFQENGAAGVVVRAKEIDGVVTAMYSVIVSARGLGLWRYLDKQWTLLFARPAELPAGEEFVLVVEARGATLMATLNGLSVFSGNDGGIVEPGRVGIRATEGPCAFYVLNVEQLD